MAHVPIKASFNLSKIHEIKMGFDFSKGYLSNFGLNYQPYMKKFLFVLLVLQTSDHNQLSHTALNGGADWTRTNVDR